MYSEHTYDNVLCGTKLAHHELNLVTDNAQISIVLVSTTTVVSLSLVNSTIHQITVVCTHIYLLCCLFSTFFVVSVFLPQSLKSQEHILQTNIWTTLFIASICNVNDYA